MKFERKFALQFWLMRSAPFRWLARVLGWAVPRDKGFGKFDHKKDGHHDDAA